MKRINPFEKFGYKNTKDKNNCTVVAIKEAFGISYLKAYEFMRDECGRKDNHGVYFDKVFNNTSLGKKCTRIVFKGNKINGYDKMTNNITLRKFTETYNEGVYIVNVRGHLLVVKDGVVYDHSDKPRRQVKYAYKVN